MKTHELVYRGRTNQPQLGRRISVELIRQTMRLWVDAGYVVEVAPDDWEMSDAGLQWFAGYGLPHGRLESILGENERRAA